MSSLNRRQFLRFAGLAAGAAVASACGSTPAPTAAPVVAPTATTAAAIAPTATTAAAAPTSKYSEAPAFAAMVTAGTLPPVEERLPAEPMVVTPWDSIGTYGGTWHTGLLGKADRPWISRSMANEPIYRWAPDLSGTIPNVATGIDVSDDGMIFTVHLRQGMRWSDGEPFTADDFVFWYEDVVLNDELTKVKPAWMRPGGTLGKVEKVDDVTVRFTFSAPHGMFITQMGSTEPFVPAHFAKQWHIKYNKEVVEKAVADQKLQDWVALYTAKMDFLDNVDRPTHYAWKVTTGVGSATQVVAQRNPYYWKVDPEGNQLPYIDEIVYPIVEKVDVLVLKALAGEVDMMYRHIATPDNKAVFVDNKEKGGFDFYTVNVAFETPCAIGLNLAHKDPGLREIFIQKDFRVALSLAMDRQEIIDTIYVGDGQPRQPAPLDDSAHYHEELAYQYTEYDPDTANQLLDDLGLVRGADGMRTRLDGTPLFFTIEVAIAFEPWAETMGMVSNFWKEVGINTAVKSIDRSLFFERLAAYDHDCMVWTGADGVFVLMDPRWYMPYTQDGSVYGGAWADYWRSGGELGEEPPEAAKQQQDLFDELLTTVDPEGQKAIMRQILDIAVDQFWAFSITKYYNGYGIVKTNFKNVPAELWDWHICNAP
ncbi:MAG: ABC transporter substrate-binding protein, partial [Anaerolineae bacterium]